jgi:hypothetical protein
VDAHVRLDCKITSKGSEMTKPIIFLAVATMALTPKMAPAEFYSGNELFQLCTSYQHGASLYIGGALDAAVTLQGFEGNMNVAEICMPPQSLLGQAKDIVCRYLENHPEHRHFPAAGIVIRSVHEAFPCKV